MKSKLYVLSVLSAASFSAHAALYTYSGTAAAIPDNDVFGLSQSQTLSGLSTSITAVTLNFTLAGGLITDLTTATLRLGNLPGSTFVDLTPSMSGSLSAPVTFTVDVSSAFNGQVPITPGRSFLLIPVRVARPLLRVGAWTSPRCRSRCLKH